MIQILWRCGQCSDYGTVNLGEPEVVHIDRRHQIIITDPRSLGWDVIVVEIEKIKNSGVQS